MPIEKISTVTLRQKVYTQLRAKILGAELLPGEIINLRSLAEKFGVSLLPVREAVWQLAAENILVVESNKRIQVNHLTSDAFQEVLDLRLLLESEAVDKACQKRPAKAVAKVERILEAMHKHLGRNHKAYIRTNDQFHQTIYAYAASPLLLDLIQRLLARVNPYIYLYAVHDCDLTSAMQCHEEMLAGFADGDSSRAIAALQNDLKDAGAAILERLKTQVQPPAAGSASHHRSRGGRS
ncbi:MAG: GntR family transcriptional regulator [Desulfosarcinaceae bacterium]|nr:GntR family transcriptional regulator [Desulfosarcinaceae bacterium]